MKRRDGLAFEFKREGMEEGGQKRNREWKVLERDERGHLSIEIDRRTFPPVASGFGAYSLCLLHILVVTMGGVIGIILKVLHFVVQYYDVHNIPHKTHII